MDKKNVLLSFWISCLLLIATWMAGCSGQSGETQKEIYCIKKTKAKHSVIAGEKMNLTEAKRIAMSSECSEVGTLQDSYSCNELEGTWSIPVDINVKGCSAVCIVDIEKKEAKLKIQC